MPETKAQESLLMQTLILVHGDTGVGIIIQQAYQRYQDR